MSNLRFSRVAACALLLLAAVVAPSSAGTKGFTLENAVPADVYLFVAERHNPEQEFLDAHWQKVLDALGRSGLKEDVIGLIGSRLGEAQQAEMERLKARATELLAGVSWKELGSGEMAFVERLTAPPAGTEAPFFMPEMVWLLRGSAEGAARNFDGLVAILEGTLEEVGKVAGEQTPTLEKSSNRGTSLASVNLTASVKDAPAIPVSVALRDDLIVIALGQGLRDDVLGLLDGSAKGARPLGKDARFRQAFKQLPAAEDTMTFVDVQALLGAVRGFVDMAVAKAAEPQDIMLGNLKQGEGFDLTEKSVAAYIQGDFAQALALVEQAYAKTPWDTRVLYNSACFNALNGHREKALDFLERAVAAGFWMPRQIAADSDLASLRDDPRYASALAVAEAGAARMHKAPDAVVNSIQEGEAHELCTQAWSVYEQGDYAQGLALVEQAYAKAPEDSRVLYYLACFHALTGDAGQGLDFLERAVTGGFYSPRHIASDPDLASLRSSPRYAKAFDNAITLAATHGGGEDWSGVAKRIVDRVVTVPAILDWVASVESTDGYSVSGETIVSLVENAKQNPFYPVLASSKPTGNYARYLPQETLSFSVSQAIDLGQLYRFILDSVRGVGPKGEELLAKWDELQNTRGFSVEGDVLAWLQGDFVSVTLENDKGSLYMLRVTDEELARSKMTRAIDLLTTGLAEAAKQNPMLGMIGVTRSPTVHEGLEGFENLTFAMAPATPLLWGVRDGQLMIGSSPEAVLTCLATAAGKHPGLRDNPRIKAEMLEPEGAATSVSLTDQRQLGKEIAQVLGLVTMGVGMAGAGVKDEQARGVMTAITGMLGKLTTVATTIDFYKSTASYTTFDGSAWRVHKVTHYAEPAPPPAVTSGE